MWEEEPLWKIHHLAPDALSPLGGYPENDDDGRSYKENAAVKKCSKTYCSLRIPKIAQRL
jgi:hypothetical protein